MPAEEIPAGSLTARRGPQVVAIMGGRSGVGKSSLALNVGIILAKSAARVCIIDADSGDHDTSYMLGLAPAFTLEHVLYRAKNLQDTLLHGPNGLKILSGAQALSQGKSLQRAQQLRLRRELEGLENSFDWFLVDTPYGVSEDCLDMIGAANLILVVITPEPTTLSEAFTQIKFLHQLRGVSAFHVVVNMCLNADQAKELFHRFSSTVEKYIGLKIRFMGHLLRDESVRLGFSMQNPVALFPDHDPSTRGFLRLAEVLDRVSANFQPTGFSHYWSGRFAAAAGTAASQPEVSVPATAMLADLRNRWFYLLERGEEVQALGGLLEELIEMYVSRFGDEASIQARQFQQVLSRRLRTADPPHTPATGEQAHQALHSSTETPAQPSAAPASAPEPMGEKGGRHSHRYLAEKFGEQHRLLARLRSSSATGRSTFDLLDLL